MAGRKATPPMHAPSGTAVAAQPRRSSRPRSRNGRRRSGSCVTARAPATSRATAPRLGGLHAHRHRRSRRRRAALAARRAPGRRARRLVRRPAGRRAAGGRALLALPARAPDRRPLLVALDARRRRERAPDRLRPRRAPAREGVRHPRPAHDRSASATRYPELAEQRAARRQVLFPAARRRELVRRDPAPAQLPRHADARAPRPTACSSSPTR